MSKHNTISDLARREEMAFAAVVLAPKRMKARAATLHASAARKLAKAIAADPIPADIAAMGDDDLLAALNA